MADTPARIVVTRRMPPAVEERLAASGLDVAFNEDDRLFTRADTIRALQEADGILLAVGDPLDGPLLDAEGRRRTQIIANFGVGVNHIDLDAARDRGVIVTNTPGVLTDATADTAMMLILQATRRASEMEMQLRRGEWGGFSPTAQLGMSVQGKTLGVIGMGRIGAATARRAVLGFGMRAIYFNRSAVGPWDLPAEARPSIEAVMEEADVVTLHAPGGGANRGLISAERIARMKPTAYLVNTARGDVIDETALVAALVAGRIAGAGLDVFAHEPEVPAELVALANVTLLPHIGSATLETRTAMGMLAADNLIAHFRGEPLPSRVV
ncbi:D-glycerate dehydrogenase [Amaricoccus sp.]|uniref:2-hydroxyacid dehydrogenase n=1 Tax=Amaricoccus sp. TaxID=1872485 RepID=UPI001B64F003|nr:D-glycerate dehydrogenase [Amaricoccus sp.]MBP7242173.1 D-glycerate dehydrogenase [Amaricoccus sp.]